MQARNPRRAVEPFVAFVAEYVHRWPRADIQYYVGSDFHSRYARDRNSLRHAEQHVERAYAQQLERSCQQQKTQQRRALYVAQQSRNDRALQASFVVAVLVLMVAALLLGAMRGTAGNEYAIYAGAMLLALLSQLLPRLSLRLTAQHVSPRASRDGQVDGGASNGATNFPVEMSTSGLFDEAEHAEYDAMSKRELERLCKENDLSPWGSKRDMVKRLGPPNVLLSIGFDHRLVAGS